MTSTSVAWWEESVTAATAASVPLLLLSPPETAGGETTSLSHQPPETPVTKRKHLDSRPPLSTPRPSSAPHNSDEGEGADGETGGGDSVRLGDDSSPLDPDVQSFLLLRSSPVISRGPRPVSWHGGHVSSSCSSPGSLSLDQRGHPALIRTDGDCPRSSSLQDKKQRSSPLNHLLTSLFHLPSSGKQGLAEKHRGRRPASCEAPPTAAEHSSVFPEFPADIFKMNCELEKENAHLVVVDLVLEALEAVKWTLSDEGHTSPGDTQTDRHTHGPQRPPTSACVAPEDGGRDAAPNLRSAEGLAQRLVLAFRRSWFPSHEPQRGRTSLRSSLQELPGSAPPGGGSLTEEIRLRTRMRGSLSWTPPALQIIFTVQPTLRRSDVVASQHFLCAGCGTKVEPRHMKRLRYCEYLGRYFCDGCHGGSEAVIPARVLCCWNFNRFPVSDFSKQLLDSVWFLPLFDLSEELCSRVRELHRFRELLDQLFSVRKLLKTCRFSDRVRTELEQLPSHLLLQQPPLLSMDDLLGLRKGHLVARVKAAVHAAMGHVENCELCLSRGFFCELCRDGGVLFPFQSSTCSRCPVCRTCFHKHCFVEKKCPKCSRMQTRRTDVLREPSDASPSCQTLL